MSDAQPTGDVGGTPEDGAQGDMARLLEHGAIALVGQLAASSNETFLVELNAPADDTGDGGEAGDSGARETDAGREDAPETMYAIYKPELGERPLHDFAPGLHRRERAAFVLSEWLGWGLVPRTVIRDDAPFGVGSLQAFVPHDPREHYFVLHADAPETHDELRRIAVFDVLANNTDRKAGHVLRSHDDGRIWGIDHGLCFSADYKLRTVLWEFQGEPIPERLRDAVGDLIDDVPAELTELLDAAEVRALRGRARALFAMDTFPVDPTGMRYPWPLV